LKQGLYFEDDNMRHYINHHHAAFFLEKLTVFQRTKKSPAFIIIFLYGSGRLNSSGIEALPSFAVASTISSSSTFVVEGVFRKSGVVHPFEMVYPVLFVFGFHVLYSRGL
jgi:hypothetical protein